MIQSFNNFCPKYAIGDYGPAKCNGPSMENEDGTFTCTKCGYTNSTPILSTNWKREGVKWVKKENAKLEK